MSDLDIFNFLLKLGKTSKDSDGIVASCLSLNGKILAATASADDGLRHAEDLVLEQARNKGIQINNKMTLYSTLEPCCQRDPLKGLEDCTTIIIKSGVRNIVYAAKDPADSKESRLRCEENGIKYLQFKNQRIITESIKLFNSTVVELVNKIENQN